MASGLQNIETVDSPFRKFVTTIGVFPTAFTDAMTYYECLAYLVKYMEETLIPAINENAEAVEELQTLYIQLKSFVDNYFDNLDVQEEINNKLDQMAEDGTLQEIITAYIQANVTWTFDTVAEMKTATNLVNGSYARTLGFYTVGDGGGATYLITNTGTANEMDIIAVGSLFAVMQYDKDAYAEQFGAKAEEEFNNRTILNYALTKVNTLRFHEGDFYVTSSVTLNSKNTLIGNKTKLYSDTPYILKGNTVSDIYIKGIEFESSVDTSNTVNMDETNPDERGYTTLSSIIDIYNSSNITIKECKVHGSFTGIFTHLCYNVLIEDCECYEASSKIICCSASQYRLVHNYIHDVKIHENDYYPCYLFQSTDTLTIKYQEASVIDGNRMLNNENWDAIMCHQYNGMVITNNFIKGVRTGIDLSLVASESMNGNTVIDSNYIEQCTNNRWTEPGIDHGIFIGGSFTDNENIIISNNIIKDFGKFNSPSGGCVVLAKNVQNVTMSDNIITFNSTLDSIAAAIMLGEQLKNINITSNSIVCAGTMLPIMFNHATIENINIKDNILSTGRVVAIDTYNTVTVSNASVDNIYSSTYEMYMRSGNVFNGQTFTETTGRTLFTRPERYTYAVTGGSVPANSYLRVFINKTALNRSDAFNAYGLYSVSPIAGTLPNDCYLRLNYADSNNLVLFIYNNSGTAVTVSNFSISIKIES